MAERGGVLRELIEGDYARVTARLLRAVAGSVSGGEVARLLNALDVEVRRLEAANQRLTADNVVLRALLGEMRTVLGADARLIGEAMPSVQAAGAGAADEVQRQLAFPNMRDDDLARIGVAWNRVEPQALAAAVRYTDSAAWAAELSRYPSVVLETINNQVIRGMAEGWGPRRVAQAIRMLAQGVPARVANTLARTTYLESYRTGTAVVQAQNAAIIERVVRIGTLDDRICLACLSLHGTDVRVGEKIRGHHNCRCTTVAIVRGSERSIQTGAAWFAAQDAARQRRIAGNANYVALRDGAVSLDNFQHEYDDPVFGPMVNQGSLVSILGDGASAFYGQ